MTTPRLATYSIGGVTKYGAVTDAGIVDLSARFGKDYPTLREVIAAGALMKLAEEGARHQPDHALDAITWQPPIPAPEKIICIGVNYPDRNAEYKDGQDAPKYPSMFMRTPRSFVGHNAPLVRPRASAQLDYEGELVLVIGKAGRHIKESDALDHIAAVTLCNEGTIRDWVRHAKFNVTQGKNFDSTGSLGPWIVPYTDESQIADIRLTTRVNGETRQDDRTGRLIFGFRYLINYLSTFTTLVPGDVIVTGTPTGAGARFDPPRYLKPGDVIEVEAEGVGRRNLINPEKRVERTMKSTSGGEAIVNGLVAHGVDTVFGLPGAQTYGLFDAFHQAQLKVIGARHEQACGYMAFGYARSSGRPGVFSVVPGPGVLNAGAALLTAFGCNEPVLCLTGQVPTQFLGKGRGHLHEMPDQIATLRTFVKWADRIEYPDVAPAMVSRAFQEMMSGRRGPVSLEMPWDVFTQRTEVGASKVFDTLPAPQPDPDRIKAAADLIKGSKRPMIFVGSGAIHAREEILELAEMIDAPVVAFRSGRGIVSNAHELGLTMAAAYRLWPTTDLMIGIGTRLELPTMSRWPYRPDGLKSVRIDIDPVEMRRYVPDAAVIADAKAGTADLAAAVKKAGYSKGSGRRGEIREATAAAQQEIQKVQPQMAYLNILREVLPANAIVTDELSQVGFASWYGFPIYEPRTFITSGYQGTLGSGFPTALGAKVANPDRPVVAITGDGGFMFGVQELSTAVQFKIGVVTLVFNNNAYGNVRRDQRERFDGRVVASNLVNPDFVKLAESFGVGAARVTSPDHFRPALEKALADGGPYVISVEVPTDSEVSPWAFIHPAKNI
jgi:acetolactate synthase-1/2/3 large subunit